MSPEQQIDRSVLAGKDREELHTIAGAIGVKAATRMRKADLIEAILDAANGGGDAPAATPAGDATKPRRVRSARSSQLADADPIGAGRRGGVARRRRPVRRGRDAAAANPPRRVERSRGGSNDT